ncbi:putative signal transducing protein [Chloroflexota bacterium]
MSKLEIKKQGKLVRVYRAAGEAEAMVIKGLLESNGIPCLLSSNAALSVHVLTVDGMGEVGVMVLESMAERAKELIRGE